jgi:bacillithiol synthase
MVIHHVGFDKVKQFSKRDKDYQLNSQIFSEYLSFSPDEKGLLSAIDERIKYKVNRSSLHEAISHQYKKVEISAKQLENIDDLLSDDSFTVITAHQPALFTGPFYYITKIVSTIVLAEHLSKMSGKKIIPVFINGSEDHDFEEVNHLTIYGKKVIWNNEEKGPVGRMSMDGLKESFDEFKAILGESENANTIISIFQSAMDKSGNYNDFVFYFLNLIFKNQGLIVVNTDDPILKRQFIPVIKKELTQKHSHIIVEKAQKDLEGLGYKPQAHARDINLFYFEKGLRERIVFEDGNFKVLNTNLSWSEEEILNLVDSSPEFFSPNVILRPVYQESIFPNIAYIGGGGELAYWQERKELMKYFGTFMPVLIRRNSTMFVLKPQLKTAENLGLNWKDLFEDVNNINQKYLQSVSTIELDLSKEKEDLIKVFSQIADKAIEIEKGLKDGVEVERTKALKQIESLEARMIKSLKKNEETAINQIAKLHQKLFPGEGLQERVDNFFQYFLIFGDQLLPLLFENLNPLNKELIVIVEED